MYIHIFLFCGFELPFPKLKLFKCNKIMYTVVCHFWLSMIWNIYMLQNNIFQEIEMRRNKPKKELSR